MDNYRDNIYEELSSEYVRIREANKLDRERTAAEVYAHIPRVKEIDDQIGEIGLGVASAILGGEASPAVAVEQMQETMNALVSEKSSLLKAHGYSADALKERYSCDMCRDKGYVGGKRCACYNRMMSGLLQKYSNICMSGKNSFDTFNADLFSERADAKYGSSPRDNIRSVLDIARAFAEGEAGAPANLLFYGATGLGKTFTSDCIAKRYIARGKTVFYMSAPRMFSAFEDYKFGRDQSARTRRVIDSVNTAELLIIDDLGTEFKTAYSDSILFDVVNTRIIEEKPMIISTNLSARDLKHVYSERICSRILGKFTEVLFFGEDLRLKDC